MIIFHHNDQDGFCAAALLSQKHPDATLVPMDYTMKPDFKNVFTGDRVFIVDFSFEPEDMRRLLKTTPNVVWLDHHISSIRKYDDFEFEVEGIRNTSYAGCELAWLWLEHRGRVESSSGRRDDVLMASCPFYVSLIADRDLWRFKFGELPRRLHAFLESQEVNSADHEIWKKLARDKDSSFLGRCVAKGEIAVDMLRGLYGRLSAQHAYEADWEGHRILVMNSPIFTSEVFGKRIREYPFVASYVHTGTAWRVSLYSENMDVVHMAEKHGGGGHPRACGFVSKELPFRKVEK